MIATATGGVPAEGLGRVLMHEHVFVLNAELLLQYPSMFPEEEMVQRAVAYLREVKTSGVDTFVDLSVMGLGRNVPVLRRIAEEVDLNLVLATGWYTYHEAPSFAQLNGPGRLFDGPDPLAEMFVTDITVGISDTGARAAVLKCTADRYGMTEGVMNVMQAVVDAHQETGAPIFTHSDPATSTGVHQLDYFDSRGVALDGVVIGHCGDTEDLDLLRSMADRGCVLGMDRFGLESKLPYEARLATVAAMCRAGYADRMVISTDSSVFSMNFPDNHRETHLPLWDARVVMPRIVGDLRQLEVSEADLDQMLRRTPARILGSSGARRGRST